MSSERPANLPLILKVAIDTPLRRLFDYLPPADVDPGLLQPGQRLWLPFGRRRVVGMLMAVATSSDLSADRLRPAHALIDTEPALDATLVGLLHWAADYYHHPLGEVVAAALPGALREGAALTGTREAWQLSTKGHEFAEANIPARATRQRAVFAVLADGAVHEAAAFETIKHWREALRMLIDRGFVDSLTIEAPAPTAQAGDAALPTLSAHQQAALERIDAALGSFHTLLLEGVTGSGKTEVYLRAIASVLARGEQALVLAPEIALTPQLVERFRARLNVPVAVLHSALNDGERLDAWRAARSGAAGVVIGTRSAIFAMLHRPGLIIVDEEHDASYKQQEGFRYSARDLAILRAQRHGVPVLLGSATPSLESLRRAQREPASHLKLPERAGDAQPPTLKLIDLRRHAANQGLSTPVMLSIRHHLDQGGQVLVYLNRRGYAPVLFCPECGWSAPCPHCDARLTVHRKVAKLVCHHCAYEQALIEVCPSCHAAVKPVGQGTERIEEMLAQIYPDAPLARIDRDSIRRKGELDAILARIHNHEVKLLVGTQMLSKGHHFPDVTLAVILNADQGLFSVDFRASERLAQSILQVAGRAGRGARAGEVLIQSEYPDHPLLQCLLSGGYDGFATAALAEREAAHWPPFARLALLRADATELSAALRFLDHAKHLATDSLRQRGLLRAVTVLGPVPAPMTRRAGLQRAQLLLQAATPGPLQQTLSTLVRTLDATPDKRIRWSVDVDPLELF